MAGGNTTSELVVRDLEGNPILTATSKGCAVFEPDGTITNLWTGEGLTLVCGRVWNPDMQKKGGPTLLGGVCDFCRNPPFRLFGRSKPKHGVCSLEAGRLCDTCGRFTCPQDRALGEDGLWRCPRCEARERRRAFWRSVFFCEVKE